MTVVDIADQSPIRGGGRRNRQVAERLRAAAELLELQQANPFRVNAYRRAAETLTGLHEGLAALLARRLRSAARR